MRIGELLLLQERIDPWVLTTTLKQQAATQQRLVSLLIKRALLDPDDGALLLSEQLGYPAAMQRHLERRDPTVGELVPAPLGARWVVLPVARARTDGALVVVARDPTPILAAALEHATKLPVLLAVTPSVQLERLVRAVYGASGDPEEPLPVQPPTMSEIGDIQIDTHAPASALRARTVSSMFAAGGVVPVRSPFSLTDLEAVLAEVDHAITPAAAERVVLAYAAKRWRTALLGRIEGDRVIGVRGHGARVASLNVLPRATLELGLGELLESAAPTLATETVGDHVTAVLAVGDPLDAGDLRGEVERLVDALGAVHARLARGG
jgi:hypothetical protein